MVQKPEPPAKKVEIDPSEVDKRFDTYFQNLSNKNTA